MSIALSVFMTTSSRGFTSVCGAAGIRWKRFIMAEQILISCRSAWRNASQWLLVITSNGKPNVPPVIYIINSDKLRNIWGKVRVAGWFVKTSYIHGTSYGSRIERDHFRNVKCRGQTQHHRHRDMVTKTPLAQSNHEHNESRASEDPTAGRHLTSTPSMAGCARTGDNKQSAKQCG